MYRLKKKKISLLLIASLSTSLISLAGIPPTPAHATGASKVVKILEIKDLDKPASGDTDTITSDLSPILGSDNTFKVETVSMKKFVALRDELDGKYDAIYFGKSLFNPTPETGSGSPRNHNTRYEENDITTLKSDEIRDKYISKGLPVIVYDDSTGHRGALQQGYLNSNNNYVASHKKLYDLFAPYNATPKPNDNVIFVSSSDISSKSNFITKTNITSRASARPQITLNSGPKDYTVAANQSFSYTAGDTLTYNFDLSSVSNISQRNLVANLYLGVDSVLGFNANQLVATAPVTSLNGNTISFTLPKGYSGLYYWRLEVVDQTSTGKLKDAVSGVFRFKDQKPVINVLQVLPDNTSNASSLLNSTNLTQSYLDQEDYTIKISVMNFSTFNASEYAKLNSRYDMLIFGFNDEYNKTANITQTPADAVKDFIRTGQGVMFTHDTVYEGNQTWITNFQIATGQTGTKTNLGLSAPYSSTSTKKVNEGLLTQYPFYISGTTPAVATTHDQYYKLDLEDKSLIPWYNIDGSPRDKDDSWNHYYTYSKGNVTYSGTGHNFVGSKLNSNFPDWEQKLFVNTMFRAFIGSNHKPTLDILAPVPFSATDKNYISSNSDISVSFKPNDLDLNDKKVTSSITFKYTDASGRVITNTVMPDTETVKGETVTKTFTNPLAATGGDLTISVTTKDAQGAMETKEVVVKVITSTNLTPDRTISADKVEKNSSITVNYAIKPTAKDYSASTNVSDLTISGIHYRETFPANLQLSNYPTTLTKTGTLANGFTLEGDLPNITYRREGNKFVADNYNFQIVVQPTTNGDYSLTNALLSYRDYLNSTSSQSVQFPNKVFSAYTKLTSLSLDNITIAKGDVTKLLPKYSPDDATYHSNENFTWSSDATSNVTVTSSGQVTGVNAGTARITVTATDGSGLTATGTVSVIEPGLNIAGPSEVAVGSAINLQAALVTAGNEAITSLQWSSSNNATAQFTVADQPTGTLSGKQPGTVTVTVTVTTDKGQTYTKTYTVTVYQPLTSLSIQDATIRVGEEIRAAYGPVDARNTTLSWSTTQPSIVDVSGGTIKGLAPGTASVTVKSTDGSNLSSTATITVKKPSLTFDGPTMVKVGDKITIQANLDTVNEQISSVKWLVTAEDQQKATFTENADHNDLVRNLLGKTPGVINGSISITTDKGNTYPTTVNPASFHVTVYDFNLDDAKLLVGETATLNPVLAPAGLVSSNYDWSSSNTSVVSVDSNGMIKGNAAGTATITVTSKDNPNIKDTATITVSQYPVTIDLNGQLLVNGSVDLNVGDAITLTASFNSSNQKLAEDPTWEITDASHATDITPSGKSATKTFKGLQEGTVTGKVTVTTTAGVKYTSEPFTIHVKNPIQSVDITRADNSTAPVNVNDSVNLKAVITPSSAAVSSYKWFILEEGTTGGAALSSDSSSQVTFTGRKRGNVIVKLLVIGKYNEEKSSTITINVKENMTAIQLPEGPIKLTLGSATNSARDLWNETTVVPSSMKSEIKDQVNWSVSDSSVIKVVDGVVTGVNKGTATVTATYTNDDGTQQRDTVTVIVESPRNSQNKY
ncbi:DUF5057 domain-containing protein [Paenibacillus aestuarii]|uniref:DUF5057 domain-containing protein n=1 Tax=Paenibacillus aestuarii TaxID=516965 RepID=A0ABW0KI20_9BACL|nr:DUF5057 domain-containing protein [Paenibacillus aestuarii]